MNQLRKEGKDKKQRDKRQGERKEQNEKSRTEYQTVDSEDRERGCGGHKTPLCPTCRKEPDCEVGEMDSEQESPAGRTKMTSSEGHLTPP